MTTIDIILLVFVGLLAILGFIRGIVSQAMAIAGLIAAYFFAAPLSVHINPKMAAALGSTEAYAKPFAVLWAAVIIYIGCRLLGFVFEKIFISNSTALKSMNRIGGGFLGAVKACMILMLAFYILKLVPQDALEAHAPKVAQSKVYQFFTKNELMDPKYIQTLTEPMAKPAQELMQSAPVSEWKSATDPKNKKTIEKTESNMNNEELTKVLQKNAAPAAKKSAKKPAKTETNKQITGK